jgi:hypothetical protein
MDDFDDGEVGLPDDEMSTELPDLDTGVDSEVEIEIEGVIVEPAGRASGGARVQAASTPRKSSGGALKSAAKPAKKAAKTPAKKAARKAKPARKAAKKAVKKSAKKAPKKARRKAGRKK